MSGEIWVNSSVRSREGPWDAESGSREKRSGPAVFPSLTFFLNNVGYPW